MAWILLKNREMRILLFIILIYNHEGQGSPNLGGLFNLIYITYQNDNRTSVYRAKNLEKRKWYGLLIQQSLEADLAKVSQHEIYKTE